MSQLTHPSQQEPPTGRLRDLRGSRFVKLLGLSLVLHLVFTPLAGWIGWGVWLLNRPAPEAEPLADDTTREIPIELGELFAPEPAAEAPAKLPASDPVSFIDHVIQAPAAQPAAAPAVPPAAPPAPEDPTGEDKAERDRVAAAASMEPTPSSAASLAGPETSSSAASSVTPVDPSAAPSAAPSAEAPTEPEANKAPETIENPVALLGKASTLHDAPPSVSMVLFTERIRDHELGRRVAALLPQLPQWDDYFADGSLNPVRDFDRILMFGPSFVKSAELVVGVQYNVPTRKVRAAVDQLVKRRGKWLPKLAVPAALTYADRAERLVLLPAKGFALVVPPRLQAAALAAKMHGIAGPKGGEAATFSVAKPRAPFARVGLEVPGTISQLRGRITALPDGKVLLELDATDSDEETARASAAQMMNSINATVDLVTGVSSVLSRFGFGGFGEGAKMPRVTLEATGKEIHGSQILTAAQVGFILDRIERQVLSQRRRAAPAVSAGGVPPGSSSP